MNRNIECNIIRVALLSATRSTLHVVGRDPVITITPSVDYLRGTFIRNLRETLKKTHSHVAAASGVSQSHISNIENGRVRVRDEYVVKIVRSMGCRWDDIKSIPSEHKSGNSLLRLAAVWVSDMTTDAQIDALKALENIINSE